jgi:hypothetical protein
MGYVAMHHTAFNGLIYYIDLSVASHNEQTAPRAAATIFAGAVAHKSVR